MKYNPLISVLIPAYNEELYIEKTLESILSQTYHNLEIIIIDNNSTDRTKDIVHNYTIKHPNVKVVTCLKPGAAAARNMGVSKANGTYIVLMDADDSCTPERVEKLYVTCSQYPKAIVGSNVAMVNEGDNIICSMNFPETNDVIRKKMKRVFNRMALMPGTIIAHKEIFEQFPYNENFSYLEDWDFILRVAGDSTIAFQNIPEDLYCYKLNSGSATLNNSERHEYNILILRNQIMRSKMRREYLSLEEYKDYLKDHVAETIIFRLLLTLKKIQHTLRMIKLEIMKKRVINNS